MRRWILAASLVSLCLVVGAISWVDSRPKVVRLHLEHCPSRGPSARFEVKLINSRETAITLLRPVSDGTEGFDPAIVDWVVRRVPPYDDGVGGGCLKLRCGGRDAITQENIIHLRPGESFDLTPWVDGPWLGGAGTFIVSARYMNNPEIVLLDEEAGERRILSQTESITVSSNEVRVTIEPP